MVWGDGGVSLGSWRRRCSSDLGGTASGSGTGRGLAKKPPPAEASAASAATSRCSTNLRTSLKSTAPLVDVAGGTSWPLPLTGHCRPCKVLLDRDHFFSLLRAWVSPSEGALPSDYWLDEHDGWALLLALPWRLFFCCMHFFVERLNCMHPFLHGCS